MTPPDDGGQGEGQPSGRSPRVAFTDPRFALGVLFAGGAIFAAIELGPVPVTSVVHHAASGIASIIAPSAPSSSSASRGGSTSSGARHEAARPATAAGSSRHATSQSGSTGARGGSGSTTTPATGGAKSGGTTTGGSTSTIYGTVKSPVSTSTTVPTLHYGLLPMPGGGTSSGSTGSSSGTSSSGGTGTTTTTSTSSTTTSTTTTSTTTTSTTTTTTAPPPPTAKQLLQGALLTVEGFNSADPHVQSTITDLKNALSNTSWLSNGNSLSSTGGPAFDAMKKAITDLAGTPSPPAAWSIPGVDNTIDSAARQVAADAIIANSCSPLKPTQLTAANTALSAGDAQAITGHPDGAVGDYKTAWADALAAQGTTC